MTTVEILTQLESVDWEFSEADTQYLTHNIHRYSGKFIPQIASTAIHLLTNEDDTILDPYMGSGTTLLESQLKKRHSIGIDLNPLAVLIAQGKNCLIDESDFIYLSEDFIENLNSILEKNQLTLFTTNIDEKINKMIENESWRLNDPWHLKWFQPQVLHDLIDIYSCIECIPFAKAQLIAKVTFSDILRKFSNANSRYPNVMFDKNAPQKSSPYRFFKDLLLKNLNSSKELSLKITSQYTPAIYCCSNLNMPIDNSSIDAIITHPPYIAAIPYAEYGALSLHWLGFDERKLDNELTGGKRQSKNVISRFSTDYSQFFMECYRVLKNSKYLFIMVGNPTCAGEKVDLCAESILKASGAGFSHIFTGTRNGVNRRGNNMGNEFLLLFQKK